MYESLSYILGMNACMDLLFQSANRMAILTLQLTHTYDTFHGAIPSCYKTTVPWLLYCCSLFLPPIHTFSCQTNPDCAAEAVAFVRFEEASESFLPNVCSAVLEQGDAVNSGIG